jgi:predicted PurR-regulated permease PerM
MISTAVMTVLLSLVILWMFHVVVIYVLVSITLAATIRPLLKRLTGLPRIVGIAWILFYILMLGCVGGILFLAVKFAIIEIQSLVQNLSTLNVWILPSWIKGTQLHQSISAWLPAPNEFFKAFTGDKGQLVLPAMLSFLQNTGSVVTNAIIILILSIYWSINQIHFERLWLSLLPSDKRKQARGIWRKIEPEIGAYVGSQLILSLMTGSLLGIGLWLIGSPYPALLAVAGAIACLVPLIGSPIIVILIMIIGLLSSIPLTVISVLYAVAVLIALSVWIRPLLFKKKWGNNVLTLVLIIALADVFGIIGIIVAPILSVVCQIVWDRLVSHPQISGAAVQLSDLKERQERLIQKVEAMSEPHLPLITSSMERLGILIKSAEPILQMNHSVETSDPLLPHNQEKNNSATSGT